VTRSPADGRRASASRSDVLSGEVRVVEAVANTHYSSVLLDVELEVEVTFHAIVTPSTRGVEDFTFDAATVV
jgi:hypothetical protein